MPRSSFYRVPKNGIFFAQKTNTLRDIPRCCLFEDKIKDDCTVIYKLSKGSLKPKAIQKISNNNLKSGTFQRCPTPCC